MPGKKNTPMFSLAELEGLRGVALPPKLKCGRCNKTMGQAKYSTNQLNIARFYVKNQGTISKPINCTDCTGKRMVEIECFMCGKTKGLEGFAITQRKKPDTAKCFDCTADQVKDKPINEENYEDPARAFVVPDSSNGNFPEYWSDATSTDSSFGDNEWKSVYGDATDTHGNNQHDLSRSLGALSMTGSIGDDQVSTRYAYPAVKGAGSEAAGTGTSWKSKEALSSSSGYNCSAYGLQSAKSMTGTVRSFASSLAERSNASNVGGSGGVKLEAASRAPSSRPTYGPPVVPMGDSIREHEDAWQPESDEEESEEDDNESEGDEDTVI